VGSEREILQIGPNFLSGRTRIGRSRLSPGIFSHLDQAGWRLAIRDLHAYAVQGATQKQLYGIAFRVVEAAERDAINYKIQELLGVKDFAANSQLFCPPEGHLHIVDSEHVAHVCNRHSDLIAEQRRGSVAIVAEDFERIIEVVSPKNIGEFSMERGIARIIYSKEFELARMVVIEELRTRSVAFKTMYKPKK